MMAILNERGNGTLSVDGTRSELRNGAGWIIGSIGSPLQYDSSIQSPRSNIIVYHLNKIA